MLKKAGTVLFCVSLLVLFLLPVYKTVNAQERAGDANPDVSTSYVRNSQVEDIKTIIGKNTPDFFSKPIIFVVEALESFRTNGFNNVFIFYGLFFIALFLMIRAIWRFFYS